jgi:catechol 2,3-dioxygenase-like lactoylglutathione lyase family enzyme
MPLIEAKGLVHFSLPVNDLEESLRFYTEILGMKHRGKVGPNGQCVVTGDTHIILVERQEKRPFDEPEKYNGALCHQAFQVTSAEFDQAVEVFPEHGVKLAREVEWRRTGTFTGRSLYFFDPSGNRLEINDPNPPFWPEGV